MGIGITGQEVKQLLDLLEISNGGRHSYFRALRAFYNWSYSPKSGMKLNPLDYPMLILDPQKVEREILSSLSLKEVSCSIAKADNLKDEAIVILFADSGMRLRELANIKPCDIDWEKE